MELARIDPGQPSQRRRTCSTISDPTARYPDPAGGALRPRSVLPGGPRSPMRWQASTRSSESWKGLTGTASGSCRRPRWTFQTGPQRLRDHTRFLLGPDPSRPAVVRIMVTMPSEAATDRKLVQGSVWALGWTSCASTVAHDGRRMVPPMVEKPAPGRARLTVGSDLGPQSCAPDPSDPSDGCGVSPHGGTPSGAPSPPAEGCCSSPQSPGPLRQRSGRRPWPSGRPARRGLDGRRPPPHGPRGTAPRRVRVQEAPAGAWIGRDRPHRLRR